MKEIAILAIARYGDLIQLSPLLRGLKRTWPDARITLIVENRFSGILTMLPGFDRTIVLDKKAIAGWIALGDTPFVAYRQMEQFVRELEADSYDLLINITSSALSAFLSSVVRAREKVGIVADSRGQKEIRGLWGLYVFSWFNDSLRKYNTINLVDVFTRLGGVRPDGHRVELTPTAAGESFADEFLMRHALSGARIVGLQLGASEANRCWPVENFAHLSDRLQEQGIRTVLFGVAAEKELAEKAKALMRHPPVDAVGETSLEGLLSLVSRCAAVVSNDTGTMHFAAASGVPAVMLCIGPAFFRCTGPYGAGHVALQPDLSCTPCPYYVDCSEPVCRTAIPAEAAVNACRLILDGDYRGRSADFGDVRVYRSGFAPDGFLTWEGLFNTDEAEETLARRRERMWKLCLDGEVPALPEEPEDEGVRDFHRLMAEGIGITGRIIELSRIAPLPVDQIRELGSRESAIEEEIKRMGYRSGLVSPIANFLTMMRENIGEGDLATVARATRHIYETGRNMAATL